MNDELYSPQWYRIAELYPRLREHVQIHRQTQRNHIWYLLEDQATGRQHRLNPQAYQFVARLDGHHRITDVWEELLEQLGDEAPSQPELVQLVGQLHQADLLQCQVSPDVEELFDRQERRSQQRRKAFVNPLAFRTPLHDPTRLLDWLEPRTRWLFSPAIFLLFFLVVALGLGLGLAHWQEVSLHAREHLLSPRYWILLWICYPLLKALHELAHALAVRHWGGQVHEMGITLLILMPIPYVDASAANLFSNKYARILVSAAGIMVETFFAATALFVWLNVQDGMVRDITFVIMTIGGVSTVLFNANPLVKYDGYYMLSDYLEIPNLGWQAKRYWSWLARRYLLRLNDIKPLPLEKAEARWLFGYGLVSYAYRLVLMIAISSWLGQLSLLLASLVFAAFFYSLVAKPGWESLQYLTGSPEIEKSRQSVWLKTGAAVVSIILLIGVIPFPYSTVAEGVVWPAEESQVRSGTQGFIESVLVKDGTMVEPGTPLIQMRNAELGAREELALLKTRQLQTRLQEAISSRSDELSGLESRLAYAKDELENVREKQSHLLLRSQSKGVFSIEHPQDLVGRWIEKGATLAYVISEQTPRVRAAVTQQDADLVKNSTVGIVVKLVDHPGLAPLRGELIKGMTSATTQLPSQALSVSGGGTVLTREDENGLTAEEPVFVVDVDIKNSDPLQRLGARAWLRFKHPDRPLLNQWHLRWKQLFLQHFTSEEYSG
ncbi:MAG: hypothetical protein ACWA5X_08220 [bacterium]